MTAQDIAGAFETGEGAADSSAAAEPIERPLVVPLREPMRAHDATRPMFGLRPPVFEDALRPFRACQWIEGEPTRHAATCGRRSLPGMSWCEAHAGRVFRDEGEDR